MNLVYQFLCIMILMILIIVSIIEDSNDKFEMTTKKRKTLKLTTMIFFGICKMIRKVRGCNTF